MRSFCWKYISVLSFQDSEYWEDLKGNQHYQKPEPQRPQDECVLLVLPLKNTQKQNQMETLRGNLFSPAEVAHLANFT